MRYIGRGDIVNQDKINLIIRHWKNSYKKYGFGLWGVIDKKTDMLIGHCGLAWLQDNSDIELAYLLYKDYWGRGLASEAASACLNYGLNELGLKRIVALVYPQNVPSIKIIEKLGMIFEKEDDFFGVNLLMYSKQMI
jgi:ribosomal-protein-alanine N-acetyltransferase